MNACVKGRPCGSVAQWAECSHSKRGALGSSPGRATIFSFPVTFKCQNRGKNRGPTGTRTRGPTGTRTQSLSLSVRQLSCWANGRPLTFSPCLIRFSPNLLGTMEEQRHMHLWCSLPLSRTHTEPPKVKGEENIVARPGLEPRVSRLPCDKSELLSRWSTFDISPLLN